MAPFQASTASYDSLYNGTPDFLPNAAAQIPADVAAKLGTLNRNWWSWVQPYLGYFYRPDLIGLDTYELMVDTDETVQYALEILILAVISRLGEYTHPKKKIEKFVRKAIEGMRKPLKHALAEILSAVWAGFSISEILWRPDGGRIVPDALETIHPRGAFFLIDTRDNSPTRNQLLEVRQWPFTNYQVSLPLNKIVLYSHRARFGNVYGYSRLRAAYKNWFIKDQVLMSWAKCLDRYGTPTTAAKVADGTSLVPDPVTGEMITNIQYMLRLLESLRTDSLIAYDAGPEGKNEVQIVDVQRELGNGFDQAINYLNRMIFRAVLVPSLVADHDKHGSYSLGQQHFDTFTLALDFLLDDAQLVLIQQFVRRIIEVNFGKQDDYGQFESEAFAQDDLKLLSEVILNCVNAGVLRPEQLDDLNWMRERIGAPLATEAMLPQYQPLPLEEQQDAQQAAQAPGQGQGDPQQVKERDPGEMRSFSEQPRLTRGLRDGLMAGVQL